AQAVLLGERVQRAAELADLRACLLDVAADAGPRLHDRLVHLGPHALAQQGVLLALLQELAHVGSQLARLDVDDLELFFDAERELTVQKACDSCHCLSSSRMNVGTVPAPALTLLSVVAERRVSTPRVSPRKRYGSISM